MQPATRELLFRQDVPVLFLAWLVPAALLLLFTVQQGWTGSIPTAELPALSLVDYVWPLALLFALIAAVACSALQIIGKRGMLVALTYCALSLTILGHFTPGAPSFGAFQLVLLTGLLAFCLYSRQITVLALGAGLTAAALLATGLEALPFVVAATAWIAADWVVSRGEPGTKTNQKTLWFGYSFASGTIILGVLASPGWSLASTGCGPLSLAQFVPASLVGLGLAHLAASTTEFSTVQNRSYGIGMLVLIAGCGLVATSPSCVMSPSLGVIGGVGMSPALGFEFGLLTLFAQDRSSAYILTATPLIGLVAACTAAWADRPQRSAWALLLACLLAAMVLMAISPQFALFANALAIVPCAWLTLLVGRYTRTKRPTPFAGAIFVLVWLSGMNLTHSMIGTHLVSRTLAPQTQAPQLTLSTNPACGEARGPEGNRSCL